MQSDPKIHYRKRVKLGIIGALMICQIVFLAFRWVELPVPSILRSHALDDIIIIDPYQYPPIPPETIMKAPDTAEEEPDPFPKPNLTPVQRVPFVPRDKEPELIGGLTLHYPDWARKVGMEGEAFVYALINIDGKVAEAKIFKSSGYEILDEAAIWTVKKSRWQPALQGDTPVNVWVTIPVKFSLHVDKPKNLHK